MNSLERSIINWSRMVFEESAAKKKEERERWKLLALALEHYGERKRYD